MLRYGAGLGAQTRVECGLPTAGLLCEKFNPHSQALQYSHYSFTRLGVKGIEDAGDE
jgi:hypothetical protein